MNVKKEAPNGRAGCPRWRTIYVEAHTIVYLLGGATINHALCVIPIEEFFYCKENVGIWSSLSKMYRKPPHEFSCPTREGGGRNIRRDAHPTEGGERLMSGDRAEGRKSFSGPREEARRRRIEREKEEGLYECICIRYPPPIYVCIFLNNWKKNITSSVIVWALGISCFKPSLFLKSCFKN